MFGGESPLLESFDLPPVIASAPSSPPFPIERYGDQQKQGQHRQCLVHRSPEVLLGRQVGLDPMRQEPMPTAWQELPLLNPAVLRNEVRCWASAFV